MRFVTDERTGEKLIFPDAFGVERLGRANDAGLVVLRIRLTLGVDPAWIDSQGRARAMQVQDLRFEITRPTSDRVLSFDVYKESATAYIAQVGCLTAHADDVERLATSEIEFFRPEYAGNSEEYVGWVEVASAVITQDAAEKIDAVGRDDGIGEAIELLFAKLAETSSDHRFVPSLATVALDSGASFTRGGNGAAGWRMRFTPPADGNVAVRTLGDRIDRVRGTHTQMHLMVK
jgi:hypothetical protein